MGNVERFVYDSDQNVGLSGRVTQEDVVRIAKVQTASGLTLLVGVIADGDSRFEKGERAAKLTVSRIRKVLKGANETDMVKLLQLALQDAHMAMRQKISASGQPDLMLASVTVVVIHDGEVFVAHTGSTRAYRVRGNEVEQLTQDRVDRQGRIYAAIGLSARLEADVFPAGKINPGEHIVLCSDGAKEPYLSAIDEMPGVLNNPNTPALEAARTLVSLAVGRKADDNVSVAIISLPPRDNRLVIAGGVALLVLACLIIVGLFASGTFAPEPTATPTGVPTATFTPAPPTATPLPQQGMVSIGTSNGTVQDVTGALVSLGDALGQGEGLVTSAEGYVQTVLTNGSFVYLAEATEIRFARLDDVRPAVGQTVITLVRGQLLVRQDVVGNVVFIHNEAGDVLATLQQVGLIGVAISGEGAVVTCFAGVCQNPAGITIPADNEAIISTTGGTNLKALASDDSRYLLWSTICSCLPNE